VKKQNSKKLIKAITTGDIAKATRLITEMNSEEINAINEAGSIALHYAAFEGQLEVCRLIISMSPGAANVADGDGFTALHYAAYKGHTNVCKMLILKVSSKIVNAYSWSNWTALHFAAREGYKEVCELLIPKISLEIINAADEDGNTVLHLAAEGNHKEVCKVLIGNMYIKHSMKLLKQSSNSSSIQKATNEVVAAFINDMFSISEINPIDFTGYQIKLLKLYQIVDQDLLISYLNEKKYISSTNTYITKHYFTLIGVCKSVSEDSPISILISNDDCMSCMLPYLAPHSLCPELFTPTELSGESEKTYSQN